MHSIFYESNIHQGEKTKKNNEQGVSQSNIVIQII